jgi:two-component system cell cycle sensor histidine kinase/response regulator CckA
MNEVNKIRDALAQVDDPRQLLESIIAFSPVAFLIYDRDGRCVLANEATVTLFGAAPPPDYNIFEDDTLAAAGLAATVRRTFAGETVHIPPIWYDPAAVEHVEAPRGRRAGAEVTTFPIVNRKGVVTHIACAIRDATAELKLRDSSTELERLRDSGILGVFEFSRAERRVTEANDAFLTMLGFTREDVQNRRIDLAAMTPPEHAATDQAAVAELTATGKSLPREKELFRKDGTRVPVLLAGALLADTSRGIAYVLDLTERKRAERAVVEREARFHALVANSSDAVLLLDERGSVTYASDSTERVLGWRPEEIVGERGLRVHVHPDDLPSVAEGRAKCVQQPGTPLHGEARIMHKDGTYRVVEVVLNSLLTDPDVRSIVVNFRDVTETRALQQQFQQAQKMEAIGQLAGGIAHDFNNMLSAILGFAGIVASELPAADPLVADVKEIITAAERASTLTRQLLAFSRKQILDPKVLDLSVHVRQLERMLQRLLGEDVELVMSLAPHIGLVKVDPAQIEQVVLNLVINARDAVAAMKSGRITLETASVFLDDEYARSHPDVLPGPHVMLSVSDNGAGMAKHVRERIFEPFFTTKGVGVGTGLGLATVFGIVKQSGGHIWLYSEPGQGTTFKVYLPQTDGAGAPTVARAPRPTPVRGSETILLVEDETGVRSFAKRALQRAGYVVLDAANGGEALLIVEQHAGPIHLLLTDVVMPRMSGRALAERLLAVKPELRVVYMSGYTENTIVHHGVLDDGTDFIPKPIAFEVLTSKVREVLDRR